MDHVEHSLCSDQLLGAFQGWVSGDLPTHGLVLFSQSPGGRVYVKSRDDPEYTARIELLYCDL